MSTVAAADPAADPPQPTARFDSRQTSTLLSMALVVFVSLLVGQALVLWKRDHPRFKRRNVTLSTVTLLASALSFAGFVVAENIIMLPFGTMLACQVSLIWGQLVGGLLLVQTCLFARIYTLEGLREPSTITSKDRKLSSLVTVIFMYLPAVAFGLFLTFSESQNITFLPKGNGSAGGACVRGNESIFVFTLGGAAGFYFLLSTILVINDFWGRRSIRHSIYSAYFYMSCVSAFILAYLVFVYRKGSTATLQALAYVFLVMTVLGWLSWMAKPLYKCLRTPDKRSRGFRISQGDFEGQHGEKDTEDGSASQPLPLFNTPSQQGSGAVDARGRSGPPSDATLLSLPEAMPEMTEDFPNRAKRSKRRGSGSFLPHTTTVHHRSPSESSPTNVAATAHLSLLRVETIVKFAPPPPPLFPPPDDLAIQQKIRSLSVDLAPPRRLNIPSWNASSRAFSKTPNGAASGSHSTVSTTSDEFPSDESESIVDEILKTINENHVAADTTAPVPPVPPIPAPRITRTKTTIAAVERPEAFVKRNPKRVSSHPTILYTGKTRARKSSYLRLAPEDTGYRMRNVRGSSKRATTPPPRFVAPPPPDEPPPGYLLRNSKSLPDLTALNSLRYLENYYMASPASLLVHAGHGEENRDELGSGRYRGPSPFAGSAGTPTSSVAPPLSPYAESAETPTSPVASPSSPFYKSPSLPPSAPPPGGLPTPPPSPPSAPPSGVLPTPPSGRLPPTPPFGRLPSPPPFGQFPSPPPRRR